MGGRFAPGPGVTFSAVAPIAIITVTYSPGQYLAKFLDSIPAASSQGAHVVMVDNGSTDGVPEDTVERWQEQHAASEAGEGEAPAYGLALHYSGGNVGYGSGMNAGARRVQELRESGEVDAEFLIISNPDVVFTEGAIDTMLEVARRNPRAGAVGPLIREADGSAYPSARSVPRLSTGIGHALLGNIWPNNPWTQQYRKDGDLWLRERLAP